MSLVSEVQDLVNDAGIFWIDDHVYDALNEAQIELWGDLRHDIGTATITATANQEFISLPNTNIMIPQKIIANNVEWFVTSHYMLERDDRKWKALSQGQPKWFVPWDDSTLQMVPRPDNTYTWLIEGVNWPPVEISAGNLDITAKKDIKKALIFKAGALLAQNTRPDLWEQWFNEYLDYRQQARVRLRNRHSHQIRRLRPGNTVTRAHQGERQIGKRINDGQ